ncbi:hypothetical protein PLEOSDRAFT_1086013 [Pleurotus ostreatus PC15]|uniref:DUF5648 domain-containing protein n=1 Tax=Pleurotus ostreatus (strain PC15) TaxID=1137138 RepID=A0A067NN43_PLEO1|nr:hypothetical protein PLEOSDRAFT_1086013 [Pleurotus ostreatus PC15]
MKFSALLIFTVTYTTYALVPPTGTNTDDVLVKNDCTAVPNATFLLRAYNKSAKDHYYTTNPTEMASAVADHGYVEGPHMGRVYTTQQAGTVPLYRLYNPSVKDHFYTTSATQRDDAVSGHGYTSQGIAAYVYKTQICGSIPLYRLYSVSDFDHFYTINKGEVDNDVPGRGYTDQGVAGYVLPLQ